jgi:two-component sensor histidine kinase
MSYAATSIPLHKQRFVAAKDVIVLEKPGREVGLDTSASSPEIAVTQEIDLRQLRHHSKNTLQRLIGVIDELPDLRDTAQGRFLAQELERRLCLSANISDALFGFTDTPGSMLERLRQLAGALVDMMSTTRQTVRVGVSVRGSCPVALREAVLRTAHELIGNAVKHGMKSRLTGRILVRLTSQNGVTTLAVIDNGRGFGTSAQEGEGLALARSFAIRHGGSLRLEITDGVAAIVELPHWPQG